jgi:translocator protein
MPQIPPNSGPPTPQGYAPPPRREGDGKGEGGTAAGSGRPPSDAGPAPRSAAKQAVGLVAWLALSFAAAAIGGLASANAGGFYATLSRPAWAPPSWLFGPVWTTLYLLMGVAAWLVWKDRGLRRGAVPLSLFVAQLGANALWTWLFFVWRLGAVAFFEAIALWILIALTLVAFWRVRPLAGYLLIPYLLWVAFACILTYSLWQRNPQVL